MNAPFEPKDGDFQALAEKLASSSKTLSALQSANRQKAISGGLGPSVQEGLRQKASGSVNYASDASFGAAEPAVFNQGGSSGRKSSSVNRNTRNRSAAEERQSSFYTGQSRQSSSVFSQNAQSSDKDKERKEKPYMPMIGRIMFSVIPGIMLAQLFLNFLLVPLIDVLGFEFVYLYSYEEVQSTLSILIAALIFALSFLVFSPVKGDKK